jgi:hypothetical protein
MTRKLEICLVFSHEKQMAAKMLQSIENLQFVQFSVQEKQNG